MGSLHQTQGARKQGTLGFDRRRWAVGARLAGLAATGAFLTPHAQAQPARSAACAGVAELAGKQMDAGPALQACIDAIPPQSVIAFAPGRYLIETPVRIRRAIRLTTQASVRASVTCMTDAPRCAVLHLAIDPSKAGAAVMPFDIDSADVRIDRVIFEGTRVSDPRLSKMRCATEGQRPMGGGLRVNGSRISITRSVFRDMACYTALEFGGGTESVISNNGFLRNGTHIVAQAWADGLTIHGGHGLRIVGNMFRDNTDVQLIFGGCVACEVRANRFEHGGSAAGGAFAELMLHAWPGAKTGDFTGTVVHGNNINCGPLHRCGFGIMLGAAPWYNAPTFGGIVRGNRVRGAMLAMNVDRLSGVMRVTGNDLQGAAGTYPTACGPRSLPAAPLNIEPSSKAYFQGHAPPRTTSVHYCILNFSPAP